LNFSRLREILSVRYSRILSASRISRLIAVSATFATFLHAVSVQKPTVEQFAVTFVVPWEADAVRLKRPKN
jgi:hypothetical protein